MTYVGISLLLIIVGLLLMMLGPPRAHQPGYALLIVGVILLILIAVLAALGQISVL